jgi:CHAT domain-containing protein
VVLNDLRHPDDERLAEYAENTLEIPARAEIERHLADCADCRAVVTETLAFLDHSLAQSGNAAPPRVIEFRSRKRLVGVAVGAAVAAALVLAMRVMRPDGPFGPRRDRPELHELIAAVADEPTRPVEGRLSGGFTYAPPPSPTRGRGDREASPDVRIAAANLEKAAKLNDSPGNRAALGVAYLALGNLDAAIDAIEDATQRDPENPRVLSDLAAAYLARAKWWARPEDWVRALEAAERAVRRDPRSAEAYFNRALALEGLHLVDQAVAAWTDYVRIDPAGSWFEEASRHLSAERRAPAPHADNQALREQIEDQVMDAWAQAVRAGQESVAAARLEEAIRLAGQLVDAGGDRMPRDELILIERAQALPDAAGLRDLADGHALFAEARRQYQQDNQQQASERMNAAAAPLRRAGSAYALWAPVYRSIYLRNRGAVQEALGALSQPYDREIPETYHHLRGRREWAVGVAYTALGRYDLACDNMKRAVREYRAGGEQDNLIATWTIQAEAEWYLGDSAGAWVDLVGVFQNIEAHGATRRDYHLSVAGAMAQGDGLQDASSVFQDARVAVARSARSQAEAHIHRARTRARLGDRVGAEDDLTLAEQAVARLEDEALRTRNKADIRIARAEVLSATDSRQSLEEANAALQYVPQSDPATRLADLFALRARSRQSLGDTAGARQDLLAAVDAFERKRSTLTSVQDRLQAFEHERSAFKALIGLEAGMPDGSTEALAVAERARAGVLLESWTGRSPVPLDPAVAHDLLPRGTAVFYYESTPAKLFVWVLTHERVAFFTKEITASALEARVSRVNRLIRDGATMTTLRREAAELSDVLIGHALEAAGGVESVVIVPDGPLFGFPFGTLVDRAGRPLIVSHTLEIVPSLTLFLAASHRLEHFVPRSVLAIGDGHDPSTTGFAALPSADEEATSVAALYPQRTVLTGQLATKSRVTAGDRDVLHFAGHTVASPQFPMFSRLMLATSAEPGGGIWLASEIAGHEFRSTRVVVLSTCDSAAGRVVSGEGVMSVARAFFAAGVPVVVASLWPVPDDVGAFMTGFHRRLANGQDAPRALRASQLELFNARGGNGPVLDWGGFVAFGGTTTLH